MPNSKQRSRGKPLKREGGAVAVAAGDVVASWGISWLGLSQPEVFSRVSTNFSRIPRLFAEA